MNYDYIIKEQILHLNKPNLASSLDFNGNHFCELL